MNWVPFWNVNDVDLDAEPSDTVRLAPDGGARETPWSVSGPFTSADVLAAADEFDRIARYLAHATREDQACAAVPCGGDLYPLISALCTGFGRMDQVLRQVRHRAQDFVNAPDGRSSDSAPAETDTAALLHALDAAADRVRDTVATMASARNSAERLS